MSTQPPMATASAARNALYQAALALLAQDGLSSKADITQTLADLEAYGPGIDPLAPTGPDGLPFMPALLRHGKCPRDTQWLDAWSERHGRSTVFAVPADETGVVEAWMNTRIIPSLLRNNSPSPQEARICEWLLRNAPEAAVATWTTRQWREAFQAERTKDHVAILDNALASRCPDEDADHKPIERWSGKDSRMGKDHVVTGLSGREWPLGEFQALFSKRNPGEIQVVFDRPDHGTPPAGSAGAAILHLPRAPHLQRDNLVKSFLGWEEGRLDETRALMWSVADAKIEVIEALLSQIARARQGRGREREDSARRGCELLTARDGLGRGFVAFLLGGEYPRMAHRVHEALREWGWTDADSVSDEALTADGAGIAEQEIRGWLAGTTGGADAFHRRTKQAVKADAEAAVGCAERRDWLVDCVVDSCCGMGAMMEAMGRLPEVLADTANTPRERLRLEQAVLFYQMTQMLRRALQFSSGNYLGATERMALEKAFLDYRNPKVGAWPAGTFVEHVGQHGIVLDLDKRDWDQLGLFGRERMRAYINDNPIRTAVQSGRDLFEQMDAVMKPALDGSTLNRVMPEDQATGPRGQRHRL